MGIILLNKSLVLYVLQWNLAFYELLNKFSSWLAISCSENLFLETNLKDLNFILTLKIIRVAAADWYQTFSLFSIKL